MEITQKPSKNYMTRGEYKPEAIVIHIMEGTLAGTDSWFTNSTGQSAHYGIGKQGQIHQYVDEKNAAWHAGIIASPTWELLKPATNPNLYTIGIEHEGKSTDVWTNDMLKASAELVRAICVRWGIPIDRQHIIGHYEINARKPNCPAVDKKIINEIIILAKLQETGSIKDGVEKIEEGLRIIKKLI
jgi:N-acetyl-anhydromuramyl-L-alanine amidase AmpD